MQTRRILEAQVRHFIWDHFHNHHSGFMRVIRFTKEGEKISTEYHIQKDQRGEWLVSADVEQLLKDRRTTKPSISKESYVAVKIRLERLGTQNPSQQLDDFMSHRLLMMDREDHVVGWI